MVFSGTLSLENSGEFGHVQSKPMDLYLWRDGSVAGQIMGDVRQYDRKRCATRQISG
jgi:hypothetical protein